MKKKRLNLCISVCRSGSTALAKIYSEAGFASFYQPAKSDKRLIEYGGIPVNMDNLAKCSSSKIFSKETFGPLRDYELNTRFLDEYRIFGFDLSRSNIIILFRDPASVFGSWLRCWSSKTTRENLFKNFCSAELSVTAFEEYAAGLKATLVYCSHHMVGLDTRCFVPIFERSIPSLTYNDKLFNNWNSNSVFYGKEPVETWIPQIHDGRSYFCGGEKLPPVIFTDDEKERLRQIGIYEAYFRRLREALK